jgi:hypothetical protein
MRMAAAAAGADGGVARQAGIAEGIKVGWFTLKPR